MFILGIVMVDVAAGASHALGSSPEVILDRPRVGEYQPIRGSGWIAWQQNTSEHPNHYDVYVRRWTGASKYRINPKGLNGANGDIDGDLLIFQQYRKKHSGLRLFDLTTMELSELPNGLNSQQWEYWPSMSGRWLLFGRLMRNGARKIILFDLSVAKKTVLARVESRHAFLAPGQVNGDWVVWSRCPQDSPCNVVRYRISTRRAVMISNPRGYDQHAPSVDPDGTVYYARGRQHCGNRVRLVRQPLVGREQELWRLPNGDDIGWTRVLERPRHNRVLYDHYGCGRSAESDAWQIID